MDLFPLMMFACARRMRLCLFGLLLLAGIVPARLHAQVAGSVDSTFSALSFSGGYAVNCSTLQPDGKIVVGGNFLVTNYGQYPQSPQTFSNLARVNPDGTLDLSFANGTGPNNTVNCVAVQPDGKIIVGGSFTTMNGQAAAYLCRLNANGSLDTDFTTGIVGGPVLALAIQSNGAIVVGGNFSTVAGTTQTNLTRLNSNGTIDTTFWHEAGPNAQVNSVVVQPNGAILIGGAFTAIGGGGANRIARLTTGGLGDGSFQSGTAANNTVKGIVLEPSGKMVIFGGFTSYNGTTAGGIAQLTSTGSLDTSANFSPGAGPSPAGSINSVALQTDGKFIAGGNFGVFSGSTRRGLARLSSVGVLESTTTFNPVSISGLVNSVSLQSNGEMIIGQSGGSTDLLRLTNTTSTQTLANSGSSTVTWTRSNACQEVGNTTFELSTDQGATWTSLGAVSRITGGWQLTGLSLPASGYLRARGQATCGPGNGGQGLLEQVQGFGGASTVLPVANTVSATPTVTLNPSYGYIYGATLNGAVNGLGNNGKVNFQYGPTPAYGTSVTATPYQVGGSTLTSVSAAIPASGTYNNLQPATTYHYCLVVQSTNGTVTTSDATFTTLSNVDTLSSISVNGATLSPAFNPGAPAFAYDYNAVLPSTATSATLNLPTTDPNATVTVNGVAVPAGTGSITVPVVPGNNTETIVVTAQDGFTTNTYYVTVTVSTTPAAATAPSDVADVYATLKASVQAMDTSATVTFQYGPDTNYGSTISGPNASGGFAQIVGATITGLTPGNTYHYCVTVTNSQGSATSGDASFTTYLTPPPGSIDSTFAANVTDVEAAATQPNGQIVIGGFFTQVNGVPAGDLARLNADGTPDTSFNASATGGEVFSIAVQADGKILIGGTFSKVGGVSVPYLARLNADGSLDTSFNPTPNSWVQSIALQPNGQILVGGYFSKINGTTQSYLARLNTDGSLDTSFAPVLDVWVNSVALQSNGQIVIGGWFSTVNGTSEGGVARLNADGTTDTSFNANVTTPLNCVAVQTDGKVLIGGWFTKVNSVAYSYLARLNTDGTVDTTFNPAPNNEVYTISLQTDGSILIGGFFSKVAGAARNYIARLNTDGSLDPIFNPDANSVVYSIAPQSNGEVLVGGIFNTMFGLAHNGVALLLNSPASQTVSVPDLTQIRWARSGAEPEVNIVTFDLSKDGGNTWNRLGTGTRVTGGWQLTGLNLPANGLVRARGYTHSGQDTGSSGIIEQDFAYPPTITASTANVAENAVTLVITGTNFDPNAANDIVTLSNGAVGTVTQASATSLTVTFSTDPTSLGGLTATVIVDGQSSGAPVQVATVGPAVYTITTGASPTADGITSGGGTFNSGTGVTVTATPNPGYTFVNWTVNGSPVSTSASYTFNAGSNQTLTANFSAGVPAMPPWGWAILGGALLFVASRNLPATRRASTAEV